MTRKQTYADEWNALPEAEKFRRINASVDAAIAEGTHSRIKQHYCQIGDHWCDSIFHLTIDRKPCCQACALSKGLYTPPEQRRAVPDRRAA